MIARLALFVTMGVLLTGCEADYPISVRNAWVRTILPTQSVTAGYLTLVNGSGRDDRLLSVETPAFETVELHEMRIDDRGVMRMRKTGPLDIAAGDSLVMKRGGYHLMLIGPEYAIAAGNDIPLTLVFEKAGKLTVAARVRDD